MARRENYIITEEQAEVLCKHFNRDIDSVEWYEICEMLDRVIDNLDLEN